MKSCLMLIKQQWDTNVWVCVSGAPELATWCTAIVPSSTDLPRLFISVIKQLFAMNFNAAGHLCSAFLPVYSESHQQNRKDGNALQVR